MTSTHVQQLVLLAGLFAGPVWGLFLYAKYKREDRL